MKIDRQASIRSLLAFLATLTDMELLALADNPSKVKEFLAGLVAEDIRNTYVIPLSDSELKKQFPQLADRIPGWRKLAAATDYRGPVVWKVREGFTLKIHGPLAGPCWQELSYLQGWEIKNDEATKDSVVFWVPRLAEGSLGKPFADMETHRNELKTRYELPVSHATSFGSIALLFGLILAHFKRTGERVPLQGLYAASDTLDSVGFRLIAGDFYEDGLLCLWGGLAGVGFFLLGVEELES